MKRQPWTYRGCTITPETGDIRYFGHRDYTPGSRLPLYRTTWWKVTFPDNTWIYCGTKDDCRDYIDDPCNSHRGLEAA